jgi:hypothetical protein
MNGISVCGAKVILQCEHVSMFRCKETRLRERAQQVYQSWLPNGIGGYVAARRFFSEISPGCNRTNGQGEAKKQILKGQSWLQLAVSQRVKAPKLLSRLNQRRNMIGRLLNCFLHVQYVDDKVLSLPPDVIVNI